MVSGSKLHLVSFIGGESEGNKKFSVTEGKKTIMKYGNV